MVGIAGLTVVGILPPAAAYTAPTVVSLSVTTGPATGRTSVAITGTQLESVALGGHSVVVSVQFGTAQVVGCQAATRPATTPCQVTDGNHISVIFPVALADGAVPVTVITFLGGPSVSNATVNFSDTTPAPTVADVVTAGTVSAVSSGPAGGGNTVSIRGANLASATGVTFGGVAALNVEADSDVSITAPASAAANPNATSTVSVAVTTPLGVQRSSTRP